jgi:hypothetical protein
MLGENYKSLHDTYIKDLVNVLKKYVVYEILILFF